MHQGVGNRKPEASTVNSKAILTTQAQNSLQASLGGGLRKVREVRHSTVFSNFIA